MRRYKAKDRGRPGKIDKKVLFNKLQHGCSKSECARYFGVSPSAITQSLKSLNAGIARSVVMERGSEIVDSEVDALGQIKKINSHTNQLIDLPEIFGQWIFRSGNRTTDN